MIAVFSGLFMLMSAIILPRIHNKFPLEQWLYLTPVILISLLFSSYYYSYFRLIFVQGLWIVILCCIGAFVLHWKIGLAYLGPVLICSFVFSFKPSGSNNFFNYLGKLSYGIYLVHILFWYPCIYLGFKEGSMQLVFLTLISSILATVLLHKTPIRKFI